MAEPVRLADLTEDLDLYPRMHVDSAHVGELARAIESGAELPALIAGTVPGSTVVRVVDGIHRRRAFLRVLGPDAVALVETRAYETELALLMDAIKLNAPHGRRFDQQDRIRCVLMLDEHNVPDEEICALLSTTSKRVEQLRTRVVIVGPAGSRRPAKPVTYPVHGEEPRELTEDQWRVMRSSSGYRTSRTVKQLTDELLSGVADLDAPGVRGLLWDLHAAIEQLVPRPPQGAASAATDH